MSTQPRLVSAWQRCTLHDCSSGLPLGRGRRCHSFGGPPPQVTVDLAGSNPAAILAGVKEGCQDLGFFYGEQGHMMCVHQLAAWTCPHPARTAAPGPPAAVTGHGIPQSLIDAQFEQSRAFFQQPMPTKQAHVHADSSVASGFKAIGQMSVQAKDQRAPETRVRRWHVLLVAPCAACCLRCLMRELPCRGGAVASSGGCQDCRSQHDAG
jgi:hypothetical protein